MIKEDGLDYCDICYTEPSQYEIEVGAEDYKVCSEECEEEAWDRYAEWLRSEAYHA